MVARAKSKGKCLACPNKAQSRGLCWNCLHAAHRVLKSGERTEQELQDAGLILAPKRTGRPIASPFLKKLAKVKR
jgi:hypothetical protein